MGQALSDRHPNYCKIFMKRLKVSRNLYPNLSKQIQKQKIPTKEINVPMSEGSHPALRDITPPLLRVKWETNGPIFIHSKPEAKLSIQTQKHLTAIKSRSANRQV